MPALVYEEPSLVHLLILASFLYLLNVSRVCADRLLYAGIVAQIGLGIIYGAPLANLLPGAWQTAFTDLGYMGLILVVFEGESPSHRGLSTNLPLLLSNLPLSIFSALTGIALPIALSLAVLSAGYGYRPLEAFAAGAALSSTSLGTTLSALNSVTKGNGVLGQPPPQGSNELQPIPAQVPLQQSRIGTVLISAAIIDDVIGLVVASLIPALSSIDSNTTGQGQGNLAWTIIRPLLSSLLVAVLGSIVARFVLRPIFRYRGIGEQWCAATRPGKPWGTPALFRDGAGWGTEAHADAVKLFLMVAALSVMAVITNYTGTSILYGAYVAGLILTYTSKPATTTLLASSDAFDERESAMSFEHTFSRAIGPLQSHVFLPLFFASIGFAIPFLDLWRPTILWRGVVYSILMCLGKLGVGFPILAYPQALLTWAAVRTRVRTLPQRCRTVICSIHTALPRIRRNQPSTVESQIEHSNPTPRGSDIGQEPNVNPPDMRPSKNKTVTSLHPALFMGIAMVSRGEIGLLIAQLARGDFQNPGLLGDEAFLLCIWAILLCTLVGPIGVGAVVKRWGPRVTSGIWQ